VVSEEEEGDDGPRNVHGDRRTPIANVDETSDDAEAERTRATDTASEAGSLDPVTLCEHSTFSITLEINAVSCTGRNASH
jgi:hypothetical protein